MRPELHAYLDGELRFEDLPPELRAEARRWDRLLTDVQQLGPAGAPAGLAEDVDRRLAPRYAGKAGWRRALDWAVRPRTVRVSPVAGLVAAAALALLVMRPWAGPTQPAATTAGPEGGATATVYVQFRIEAPGARSVAVAGDFTEWSPRYDLQDADGDGVWTGRVAVRPGVHEYMFVIDGREWVTDPDADRYADDGFGNRNAVMVVAPPTRRS